MITRWYFCKIKITDDEGEIFSNRAIVEYHTSTNEEPDMALKRIVDKAIGDYDCSAFNIEVVAFNRV